MTCSECHGSGRSPYSAAGDSDFRPVCARCNGTGEEPQVRYFAPQEGYYFVNGELRYLKKGEEFLEAGPRSASPPEAP
jgi:hypothetical protein